MREDNFTDTFYILPLLTKTRFNLMLQETMLLGLGVECGIRYLSDRHTPKF